MKLRGLAIAIASFTFAANTHASKLPPLTPEVKDFEYTSTPKFTSFSPAGATVSLFNDSLLLYGSPATLGGMPRELELFDVINADVCYSTTCPSTTPLYPQPNYVLSVGNIVFRPADILAGTGVDTVNTDFTVSGALFHGVGGLPTGESISANGLPVLYTGDDPGGASSYVYFLNEDGTISNTLHVLRNASGGAGVVGVILDPPQSLTLDILGFANPGPNSFITAPVPEPATAWQLSAGSVMLFLALLHYEGKRQKPQRHVNHTGTVAKG
jgi:hypothetical protein